MMRRALPSGENMIGLVSVLFTALVAASSAAADTAVVRLHAAGSLRAAMADIAKAYCDAYGTRVEAVFGGSGALKERLLQGEAGGVFSSSRLGDPPARPHLEEARPHSPSSPHRLLCV